MFTKRACFSYEKSSFKSLPLKKLPIAIKIVIKKKKRNNFTLNQKKNKSSIRPKYSFFPSFSREKFNDTIANVVRKYITNERCKTLAETSAFPSPSSSF